MMKKWKLTNPKRKIPKKLKVTTARQNRTRRKKRKKKTTKMIVTTKAVHEHRPDRQNDRNLAHDRDLLPGQNQNLDQNPNHRLGRNPDPGHVRDLSQNLGLDQNRNPSPLPDRNRGHDQILVPDRRQDPDRGRDLDLGQNPHRSHLRVPDLDPNLDHLQNRHQDQGQGQRASRRIGLDRHLDQDLVRIQKVLLGRGRHQALVQSRGLLRNIRIVSRCILSFGIV